MILYLKRKKKINVNWKKIYLFILSLVELEMSKPEEVLACDSFMSYVPPFILPIDLWRWTISYYSVTPEELVITVNYDKETFEHKIGEFTSNIIKEAQKNDLY